MKRVLLVLTAIMLVFAVVGCNSNGAPTTVVDKSQQTPTGPGGDDGEGEDNSGDEGTGEEQSAWDKAVGLKNGLEVVNKGTFTDGVFTLGKAYQGDSSGIRLTLATLIGADTKTEKTGSKKLTVTYICKEIAPAAKLTIKKNNSWGAGDAKYVDLETDEIATIEVAESEFDDESEILFFQTNDYQNETAHFLLKITKVELK